MAKKQGKEGIQKLAAILDKRSVEHQDDSLVADIGGIKAGKKLKLNSYPVLIPPSDYSACKGLGLLRKGDRVLVVWAGDEPVVVDRIVNANKL